MRAVMEKETLTSYEKIKKYDGLLRCYLTLIKQKQVERGCVSTTAEEEEAGERERKKESAVKNESGKLDATAQEALEGLPPRKKAEFIIKKLSDLDKRGRTDSGEFFIRRKSSERFPSAGLVKTPVAVFQETQRPAARLETVSNPAGQAQHPPFRHPKWASAGAI